MLREISLTVDYEIFGNGTGDVRQHVTEPTERMAEQCEKYGAPLTVFLEVEEYLAFERHRAQLDADLGYDPAKVIREQLLSLVRRGHDLQLHLHPQWHESRYVDGQWHLRPQIQTVDDLFKTQEEVDAYIRDRKAVIDELYAAAGAVKSVVVYRAGAFSAQPGSKLLKALERNGITVDSSVVHGLVKRNETLNLDYRNAPAGRRHWKVTKDVGEEDSSGAVTEVPIYSVMGRRLFQVTFRRMRAKFSRNVPKSQQKALVKQLGVRKNPFSFLKFLFQPVPIKLDFDNLSPAKLVRWIRSAPAPRRGELDVLVLIGHTKEHLDHSAFEEFLARAAREPEIRIVSMTHIAESLRNVGGTQKEQESARDVAGAR